MSLAGHQKGGFAWLLFIHENGLQYSSDGTSDGIADCIVQAMHCPILPPRNGVSRTLPSRRSGRAPFALERRDGTFDKSNHVEKTGGDAVRPK